LAALLEREGWTVNVKRVHRLCRKEGLKVRRIRRKTRAIGGSMNACHLRQATHPDHVWCWDFAFDRTGSGTTLKWLSIIDEFTRECLALKVSRSVTSEDVLDTLAELFAMRGVPQAIRSDNGPEFVAQAIQTWLGRLQIKALYVAPGSPWENGYAESFHSKLVDEFLSRESFESVSAARRQTAAWRTDYNHDRPHSSLGYVTPAEFAARCAASVPEFPSPSAQGTPPLQPHSVTQPELS
jgi:transposase InsO family protein